MIDVITFTTFFLFGLYVAGRLAVKVRVVSSVPWWVGDPIHGAVGAFITRLPVEWAWLVSALYLAYQLLDWKLNGSSPVKDVATFLAGVLAGLGYKALGE